MARRRKARKLIQSVHWVIHYLSGRPLTILLLISFFHSSHIWFIHLIIIFLSISLSAVSTLIFPFQFFALYCSPFLGNGIPILTLNVFTPLATNFKTRSIMLKWMNWPGKIKYCLNKPCFILKWSWSQNRERETNDRNGKVILCELVSKGLE